MSDQSSETQKSQVNARHHYIPKMYLEGFTEEGKISVWSRKDGRVWSTVPSQAANIKGFYTFRDQEGHESDELEKLLAQVEYTTSIILSHVKTLFPPTFTGERKSDFALYLAFQYLRTPEQRKRAETMADIAAKMSTMAEINNRGDNSKEAQDFLADPHSVTFVEGKENILKRQLKSLPLIHEVLLNKRWDVFMFEDKSLITSDSPILLKPHPDMPSFYGVGLANAHEIWFPLSSSRLLVMSRQDYRSEGVWQGNKEKADRVNRILIEHSYTEAFGPKSLINQYQGTGLGNRPTFEVDAGFMQEFFDPYNTGPENPRPRR